MKIHGFQKLTLLDFPGKTAATVFTGGCNLRCPFCHNGDLVLNPSGVGEIEEEEVLALLEKRRGLLDGVCITGGEPLLSKDIGAFIKKVKEKGFLVKLDTNGTLPVRLNELILSGNVDYIAMDIKNSTASYARTVGFEKFDTAGVERSVEIIRASGIDHEFRTTLVKGLHTEKDMEDIGRWLEGEKKYFLQAFKESESILDKSTRGFEKEEMERLLNVVRRYIPTAELRGI